ncbi:C40 family peptidase [Corynebacterium anserum]|uniref:Endopeptidase n=1 Tax=Corynebacterium anserum TaxID=2684406 RepID=A0A7G7YMW4_9CORY|nr:C40 family peptidase [Corynebacterium anserum]QNH95834.1 endopeptidase [Corynebacterium anserum]
MGKHNLHKSSIKRNAAVAAAVGVGATILSPAAAQAAPVAIPNTNYSVDVPSGLADQVKSYIGENGNVAPSQAKVSQSESSPVSQLTKPAAPKSSKGQQIADFALSKIGSPYVWGAAGPNSFDCSGLTSWAHSQAGISIPRTSSAQASSGTPVSLNNLEPGDVVSYYGGASHVAIYIGDGKVVHAINSGTSVKVTDMNYMPIHNAVRFH